MISPHWEVCLLILKISLKQIDVNEFDVEWIIHVLQKPVLEKSFF